MITYFKNIKATNTPFYREIETAIERIRSGASKELVESIRSQNNKDERNKIKQLLPSICFSGKFQQRTDTGCVEHSGYICLDFDGYSENEMLQDRQMLIKDKHTYCLFTSPSGDGLKVIVKIPAEIENHRQYFKALKDYYSNPHFDDSSINISRVCYESYDSEIFVNTQSELWTEKTEAEHLERSENKPIIIMKSANKIISNLQKWFDNKYTMADGSRNKSLFVFAKALNEFGVSKFEAQAHLLKYEVQGFDAKEINKVIDSAYSDSAKHGTKFFEDNQAKEFIAEQIKTGKSKKKIIQELSENYSETEIESAIDEYKNNVSVSEFWQHDDKGKIKISNIKFKQFLEQNGFKKLYPEGSENFVFIRVQNNLIENTTPELIKDYVLNYLYKRNSQAYEYMTSASKYFKEDYLNFLETSNIAFYEDSADSGVLYFANCAVLITKDSITEIDYLNLDGYLWKKHIINRDYKPTKYSQCDFDLFINLISGKEEQKYNSFKSTIGYLLHGYKTSANNKAVIFNDETISENPNGGSGKGIICNAVSQLKRVSVLDGKQFNFNKSFPYQTVGADTQVLVFDDVVKNFEFESLFSLVTEGIILEKKNKDAIKLPIKKSPKIIITTNYTIGGVGGSFERRKWEVELSAHFSSKYTPLDEFNKMLFDDWDALEWSKFDNFMIHCYQYYLINGLVKHEYQNLEVRKFIKATSYEFYEYSNDNNLTLNQRIDKKVLYNNFIEEYQDFKKWLTQKKFTMWLEVFGNYHKYKIYQGKTLDMRWIEFSTEVKTETNEEEFSDF
jgi:hypothetical protein